MKSQYLKPYKEHVLYSLKNGKRPYSVGTYLTYKIRGNAKSWRGRYLRSLKNGLEKDGWLEGPSKLNGLAYYPPK